MIRCTYPESLSFPRFTVIQQLSCLVWNTLSRLCLAFPIRSSENVFLLYTSTRISWSFWMLNTKVSFHFAMELPFQWVLVLCFVPPTFTTAYGSCLLRNSVSLSRCASETVTVSCPDGMARVSESGKSWAGVVVVRGRGGGGRLCPRNDAG